MDGTCLKIYFPDAESLKRFNAYMCDGGGEWNFFESEDEHEVEEERIGAFQYAKEDPQYPRSDKRRYSAFDTPTIIAVNNKQINSK